MHTTLVRDAQGGRGALGLPAGVSLRALGSDLVLERRWLTLLGAAAVVFWQFGAVVMVAAVAQDVGGQPLRWVLGAVVVSGAYFAAAMALNRTRTRATGGHIWISHGPLPCPGWGPRRRAYSVSQIAQFTVRTDDTKGCAYLRLRLKSGQDVPLEIFGDAHSALGVEALLRARMQAA